MDLNDQTKTRHKTFTFRTGIAWTDGKAGTLSSEGKPSLRVASPSEFKGESGVWTPEELFVASVEACHMSTFMTFAGKREIPVISYTSHANGVLEFVDGDYRFTRIVIFPTIVVASSTVEAEVYTLLREAQMHCLVANSIASIVEVNPTIMVQQDS
jgi:organic hydroperoxide reductase OsmC/OhrA